MATDMKKVAAWAQPAEILLDIAVRDRLHALEVVADRVGLRHGIDPQTIFRALWRREQAASTGLGGGFAIPHACIAGIAQPMTVFVRAETAIPFDAPDRKPVGQMLAILAPVGGSKEDHLQLLALVAQLFSDEDFRQQLDGAPDAAMAASAFRAGIARVTAT